MKDGKRTGNSKPMACPCDLLTKGLCKPHGTLHCSIRIPGHALAGAVYKWRTTSLISIQRMFGSLQQILSICGTLTGIPLVLKLEPIQVTPAKAPASTVYCCHIELRASDIEAVQRQAIESAKMRARVSQTVNYRDLIQIPALNEDPEEEEAVQREFHPEGGGAGASDTVSLPGDTGELLSDEQLSTVTRLIDQLDQVAPGSGMTALANVIGRDAFPGDLTKREAEHAIVELQKSLRNIGPRTPRRASESGAPAGQG